ncbi:uncharacterized protein LOC144443058 [Glandiceps talaboti]
MALFHLRGITGCRRRTRHLLCTVVFVVVVYSVVSTVVFIPTVDNNRLYEHMPHIETGLTTAKRDHKNPIEVESLKLSRGKGEDNNSDGREEYSRQKDYLRLTDTFPWIVRHKYLKNFYTRTDNDTADEQYRDSRLVFLHHNKAAGTTVKTCLTSVAAKQALRIGPVMASNTRVGFQSSVASKKGRYQTTRIFMGGYSFGVCDDLESDKPCSYFTFLRNPYERVISSFEYCKRARSDQLCSVLNANEVTINEWARHQGSFFFRQVLFKPEFCKKNYDHNMDLDSEPHDSKWSIRNKLSVSCWFREKLILKNITSQTERDLISEYILKNLENWFAVIGIAEEYEFSMQLLEHTFGLPFIQHCGGMKKNYHEYQQTNKTDSKSSTVVDKLKEQLMEDDTVNEALRYDLQIYKKATEIFEKQKQVYFQTMKRN